MPGTTELIELAPEACGPSAHERLGPEKNLHHIQHQFCWQAKKVFLKKFFKKKKKGAGAELFQTLVFCSENYAKRGSMETGKWFSPFPRGLKGPASHPSSRVSTYASTHLIFKGLRDVILFKKIYKTKIKKYISSYHVIDLGPIYPHILNNAYLFLDPLKHFHIV